MQFAARGFEQVPPDSNPDCNKWPPDSNPNARPPGFEPGTFWAHDVQSGPALYQLGYSYTPICCPSRFKKIAQIETPALGFILKTAPRREGGCKAERKNSRRKSL